MARTYVVWDWWREGNIYYCLVYENGVLYFSQAEIPKDLKGINDGQEN